jgi:hypothetical protein
MSLVQSNGSQDLQIATVYYAGTSTLQEGMVVSYDNDDTNAPVNSGFPPLTAGAATVEKNLRGRRVIDPVAAVAGLAAGLVAATSSGIKGPAFIDIVRPVKGQVCNGYANISITKGDALGEDTAAPSNKLIAVANPVATKAAFISTICIAMETKDLSGTAGQILVKFL